MRLPDETLFDRLVLRGLWWMPVRPGDKFSGVVIFDPAGEITLELDGSFREQGDWHNQRMLTPAIILGTTNDGIPCTLIKASEIRASSGLSEQSQFICEYMIVGRHFLDEDEVMFSDVFMNFTHLEEWLGARALKRGTVYEEGKPVGFSTSYKPPASHEFRIPSISYVAEIVHSGSEKAEGWTKIVIEHTSYYKIRPDHVQRLAWFLRHMRLIQYFMSLMVGYPVYPRRLIGTASDSESDRAHPSFPAVHIYFSGYRRRVERSVHYSEMVIQYQMIEARLPRILDLWLSNAEQLGPVYDLYFGTQYEPEINLNFRFLALIYAIEAYHRRTSDGSYMAKAEYSKYARKVISTLPPDCPAELMELLKSRIGFANQYSLQTRLHQIFEGVGPALASSITSDEGRFIKRVIRQRNKLTHYDKDSVGEEMESVELYYACRQLRLLTSILLLKSVGFEDHEIDYVPNVRSMNPFGDVGKPV